MKLYSKDMTFIYMTPSNINKFFFFFFFLIPCVCPSTVRCRADLSLPFFVAQQLENMACSGKTGCLVTLPIQHVFRVRFISHAHQKQPVMQKQNL